MSRYNDPAIGKLMASNGREVEITKLSLEVDGSWWGGATLLSWGSILRPGLCRLVLNDGRTADLFVDELRGDGTGGEWAFFRGYGPAPDWAPREHFLHRFVT